MVMSAAGAAAAEAAYDVYIVKEVAEGADVVSCTEGGDAVFVSVAT